MKRALTLTACLTASLWLSGIQTTSAAEIKWTGCGISKKAYVTELAKAFEKKTNNSVKISGGGATKGIRTVSAGTTDVGGSCRHLLRDVSGNINPAESNSELVQVAWDALVVVAHPDNPVDDISLDNLKQIYEGKITNWKQLGGPDKRIALVTRSGKHSGVGYMFRLLVFGNGEQEFAARSLQVKSTGPLEKKVEKLKNGLAVDGISSAKKRKLKFLSLNGIAPTKENIATGKYPLFRPLYLVLNKNNTSAEARAFVDFALSPEGQQVISSQGTVNLAEGKPLVELWAKKRQELGI